MPEPLDYRPILDEIAKSAHQTYLDNWETKTQVAENGGEWNSDIQHRALESIEKLSSDLELLCHTLEVFVRLNNLKTLDP